VLCCWIGAVQMCSLIHAAQVAQRCWYCSGANVLFNLSISSCATMLTLLRCKRALWFTQYKWRNDADTAPGQPGIVATQASDLGEDTTMVSANAQSRTIDVLHLHGKCRQKQMWLGKREGKKRLRWWCNSTSMCYTCTAIACRSKCG